MLGIVQFIDPRVRNPRPRLDCKKTVAMRIKATYKAYSTARIKALITANYDWDIWANVCALGESHTAEHLR